MQVYIVINFTFSSFFVPQNVASIDLDRDNFKRQLEIERKAHKEAIDKYTADKDSILVSTDQANQAAVRGKSCLVN